MKIKKLLLMGLLLAAGFTGCSDDEQTVLPELPTVKFDKENPIYLTKVNQSITLTPIYTHNEGATYEWTIDSKVISTTPQLEFVSAESNSYNVTITVKNLAGEAHAEARIDVQELVPPVISLPGAEQGFTLPVGSQKTFRPQVKATPDTRYAWFVGDKQVSEETDYTFNAETEGTYTLKFTAENEDGRDELSFTVKVCPADEIDFTLTTEQDLYNVALGRTIALKVLDVEKLQDVVYTWSVNGEQKQQGDKPQYLFTAEKEGQQQVEVTMERNGVTLNKTLTVNVCPAEGKFYRAKSNTSSAQCNKVFEYRPAPGQFINESRQPANMEEACQYAEEMFAQKGGLISLGAFGGYVVVGFDHSIDNDGDFDISIEGNPFDNSSEPGVVWVMQDENGDGQPNDTWYELKGSEYGKPETIQDYAVTYYRPKAPQSNVEWTDNQGNSGCVDYLSMFHKQDYYYPAWVTEESYTLRGTMLKSRSYDESGNGSYWVNPAFDWGYSDNYSETDRTNSINHFKISNAVRFDGQDARLKYIDFVKIQGAVNFKCGWLGEISTEVLSVSDYNMNK